MGESELDFLKNSTFSIAISVVFSLNQPLCKSLELSLVSNTNPTESVIAKTTYRLINELHSHNATK